MSNKNLRDIVEEAVRIFPFDERYDFVKIETLEDFMNMYAVNELGQRFYLTPLFVSFYRQLKKV